MADRPILFSAPMVRALLSGRKTQTRRLLSRARVFATPEQSAFTLQGEQLDRALQNADRFRHLHGDSWFWEADAFEWQAPSDRTGWMAHLGYAVGDRLWVRETWRVSPDACEGWNPIEPHPLGWVDYRAGGSEKRPAPDFEAVCRATFGKSGDIDWDCVPSDWRPSIFMPRWTSRLTLDVTEVRIERLNACSEADALAEGLEWVAPGKWAVDRTLPIIGDDPRRVYSELWDHINGAGAWAANPWVIVITFDVRQGNIDD